jgi:hypothetical protein
MQKQQHIIRIYPGKNPYNTYLVLPMPALQQLMPSIQEEMMKGLAGSDREDRIILHLQLTDEKLLLVQSILTELEKKAA